MYLVMGGRHVAAPGTAAAGPSTSSWPASACSSPVRDNNGSCSARPAACEDAPPIADLECRDLRRPGARALASSAQLPGGGRARWCLLTALPGQTSGKALTRSSRHWLTNRSRKRKPLSRPSRSRGSNPRSRWARSSLPSRSYTVSQLRSPRGHSRSYGRSAALSRWKKRRGLDHRYLDLKVTSMSRWRGTSPQIPWPLAGSGQTAARMTTSCGHPRRHRHYARWLVQRRVTCVLVVRGPQSV